MRTCPPQLYNTTYITSQIKMFKLLEEGFGFAKVPSKPLKKPDSKQNGKAVEVKPSVARSQHGGKSVLIVPISPQELKDEIKIASTVRKRERSMASFYTVEKQGCCACCHIDPQQKKEERAIVLWHRKYCSSYEDFISNMELVTYNYNSTMASVRAVISSLTYWDDPTPGIEGLSIIGSYIWLLTSALDFVEERDARDSQPSISISENDINTVQTFYQDLATIAERFLDDADEYFRSVHKMKIDGHIVVLKMIEKMNLQDFDLLQRHPLNKPPKRRPRRHMGNGLDKESDFDDDDSLFHLRWKDHKILCRRNNSEWLQFTKLHSNEKVETSRIFFQRTLDIIDTAAEDLRLISGKLSIVEVNDKGVKSQAREITGALRNFAKRYKRKVPLEEEEQTHNKRLLKEFWSSLDRLHDDSYELLRVAQEIRDIIRTCYVYLDTFYKIALPDYDQFLLCVRKRTDKQEKKVAMKNFFEKLVMNNHDHTQLSKVMKFLCLSDYTTSIYQLVVQKHLIEAYGISMKLGHNNDEANETWGLVVGMDVRKVYKSQKRSKPASSGKSVKNVPLESFNSVRLDQS